MWSPTHVKVAVKRGQNLLTKGPHGTNDCFVTIALGKEKYQTSIKEKASPNVEWNEECELAIPSQGNTAEIVLTALHRNFLGVDEFLGTVRIPLVSFGVYERPRNRWYKLEAKKGKENKKERGELEVRIAFNVKSGSLTNLNKQEKHKTSISHLAQSVGGSLLSLGTLEKRKNGLKKFAKSFGSKVHLNGKKKDNISDDDGSFVGSFQNLSSSKANSNSTLSKSGDPDRYNNVDPGVISEDEDEFTFDNLSHISSTSSVCSPNLSSGIHSFKSGSNNSERLDGAVAKVEVPTEQSSPMLIVDEWEEKLYGKQNKTNTLPLESRSIGNPSTEVLTDIKDISDSKDNLSLNHEMHASPKTTTKNDKSKDSEKSNKFTKKFKYFRKDHTNDYDDLKSSPKEKMLSKSSDERIIIGGEQELVHSDPAIPRDVLQKFEGKSKTDLILLLMKQQATIDDNKKKMRDLEDYLDQLLLRVMETTPKILQNPYKKNNAAK